MNELFSQRITTVPRSFIREILKVSLDPEIISFAGGLPNKKYFPVAHISEASQAVMASLGPDVMQYGRSEGVAELRETIARRYREKKGIEVDPDSILITNGSQQGLDLLGKALLDEGDGVLIEEPGYLGAIQSLSIYRPDFIPVPVGSQGIDTEELANRASGARVKMLYTVPNFQNPSGVSYSEEVRERVMGIAAENKILVVEDDPYGELRFSGKAPRPLYSYLPEQTVLLGSFSKTVAPGFRVGWLVLPPWLYDKVLVAKQAADLHTSTVNQHILNRYLTENDLDEHLQIIIDAYGRQCMTMLEAAREYLPKEFDFTEPEGGMFLWGRLPSGMDSMKLFDYCVKEKVVFVPGAPFYTGGGESGSTIRLSFSCSEPDEIREGMRRMAAAVNRYAGS